MFSHVQISLGKGAQKISLLRQFQILKCRSYFATALTIYFLDEPFMPMIWLGVLVFDSCW